MYKEDPSCFPPEQSLPLWRYLTFDKFLHLLTKESLYFRRADQFSDLWEGAYPECCVSRWKEELRDNKVPKLYLDALKWFPRSLFVSSWHQNLYESDSTWERYASEGTMGVAIKTNFFKLKDSYHNTNDDVYIGKMNYIDYNSCSCMRGIGPFSIILHKRKNYEEDKEVRCFIFKPMLYLNGKSIDINRKDIPKGINIPIDLNFLIEAIYIHPKAESWHIEIIKDIVKKYGYKFEVYESELSKAPAF